MRIFDSMDLDLVEDLVPLLKNVSDENILLGFLNRESGEFILNYYSKAPNYDKKQQELKQKILISDQSNWLAFFISHQVKEDGESCGSRWSKFIDTNNINDLLQSRLNKITTAIDNAEKQIFQRNWLAEEKAHQAEMKQVSDRLLTLSVNEQTTELLNMPSSTRFDLFDYFTKLKTPLTKEVASLAALTKVQHEHHKNKAELEKNDYMREIQWSP